METLKFEWDGNKNDTNKSKHGVSFEEARTVFYDDNALLITAPNIPRMRRGLYCLE